ncbi:MAG: RecX family transcriptional regulator [Proteobacteria bacterium]|nr:RecX family transcriptional regulator [Pseudomonadota bacterium]
MAGDRDRTPDQRRGAPGGRVGGPGRRPRGPRKATPKYLRNSALYYLERYASSSGHLRRLLLAKVARSARAHGADPEIDPEMDAEAGAAAVEALIAELLGAGLLDDARYAAERARVLHRRGASARAIRTALLAKEIETDDIERALAGLREEAAEPELAAALAYARRRRLGPYRDPDARADRREKDLREKDLAALGRQGFGYDLARRVIETDDLAELEDEAGVR